MNKMFVIRERMVPVIPVSGHAGPALLPPRFSVGELLRERGSWHQKAGIIRKKPGIIPTFPPFLRRKMKETNSANYGHDLFKNGLQDVGGPERLVLPLYSGFFFDSHRAE